MHLRHSDRTPTPTLPDGHVSERRVSTRLDFTESLCVVPYSGQLSGSGRFRRLRVSEIKRLNYVRCLDTRTNGHSSAPYTTGVKTPRP